MHSYELMLIFDPNLGEDKIGGMVSKVESRIKSQGGEVEKIDRWGVRKLASTFRKAKKLTQAYYVALFFKGDKSLPGKIQNYLKVTENLIRYSILKGVPKIEAEISGEPLPSQPGVEAVEIGEIKEVGENLGES